MAGRITLPLSGVDSEHCALIVDKELSQLKDITAHKVELNKNRALIEAEDIQQVLPDAVAAIRNPGYDVPTVKKQFPVTGMSCASCAISAERMLQMQTGVVGAGVNYANGTASVEYIPMVVDAAELKGALQTVGYGLITDESDEAGEEIEAIEKDRSLQLQRRTMLALLFSVPLVVIGMFFMDMPFADYIMWALATPVVLVFGRQFFINAGKQARHRSANMDTLVAMSTGIAYLFSVFNRLFPSFWHRRGLHAPVYFEASAVVIAFILLGRMLEDRAKRNTSSAIKRLMGLKPKMVTILTDSGEQIETPIAKVKVGDTLIVKPGERLPVDGIVTGGSSYVDESMLSGEPLPSIKEKGAKVFSGTINQQGSLTFRADKVGGDTVLAHIIQAVQQAQGSKAPVQKLVDRVAGIFVPVVMGIALLSLAAWIIFGGDNGFSQGFLSMITVLVIACPCALGLATPTAIMVGVGKGAEHGILIKDAESLERAYKLNAIVLDKTGTITEGKPQVTAIAYNDVSRGAALSSILYSIESLSEHPLAQAVSKHFAQEGIDRMPVSAFQSITGKGVSAQCAGKLYHAGSAALLKEHDIAIPQTLQAKAVEWLADAATVIWLADDTEALASIAIADKVKDSSLGAIQQLRDMGIEPYMLTGDNAQTAAGVAARVGIKNYKADLLPADKATFIKELQQSGKVVAMVGDGINDSEALAVADVSIAMGRGTDIAMDVARMTLISSDLRSIPKAITLSRLTVRTIRQNLFWAFIYNLIGIPLAAGLLYPINGFLLNPMIAGAAMALSSISVVTNSLRLKWAKI